MKNVKRLTVAALMLGSVAFLAGCEDDAVVASRNLSKAADNFEVMRRVVFINGWTNEFMLVIEGRCSIEDQGNQLEVTCKVADGNGPDAFKKHFFGKSANSPYLVEQMDAVAVSVYHNRITFKPQTIIPDIDFRGSVEALTE